MTALLIAVVSVALFAAACWADRASNTTHRQRVALADFIYEQPDWRLLSLEFDEVSFHRHYRAVLLRQDPAALYSPALAAAFHRGEAA